MKNSFLRLFKLTKLEYYADFLITTPITLVLAAIALSHGISWSWMLQLTLGLCAWTLYEYSLHRWILHHLPIVRTMHDLHHEDQCDYIALHPAATAVIYIILWMTFGMRSSAATLGFSLGYLIYSALHTAFHHAWIKPSNILFISKRRHALHHSFEHTNFGVTTSVWDRLLGTEFL